MTFYLIQSINAIIAVVESKFDWKFMHILVTGGAGFIGSNFVRKILSGEYAGAENYKVTVLDALTYAGNIKNLDSVIENQNLNFVHGNILDTEIVNDLMKNVDVVVHFAAESHVDRSISGSREFIMTNVVGTHTLLEAARVNGISKFVHVSTDEVYGTIPTGSWDENCPLLPNSPYSASKAGSDLLVRSYFRTHNLNVNITRCSNNYGPYHFPEKLIPLVILNALAGKPLPIYGDGQQIRDWLYVKDHCSAIRRVLEAGKLGETYNVGGWNEKPNLDVVNTICSILDGFRPKADGTSYTTQITYVKDRPGHDRRYAIDASKLERELGWKPAETFETGIQKTVQWYLDNQAWTEDVLSGSYRDWVKKQYS